MIYRKLFNATILRYWYDKREYATTNARNGYRVPHFGAGVMEPNQKSKVIHTHKHKMSSVFDSKNEEKNRRRNEEEGEEKKINKSINKKCLNCSSANGLSVTVVLYDEARPAITVSLSISFLLHFISSLCQYFFKFFVFFGWFLRSSLPLIRWNTARNWKTDIRFCNIRRAKKKKTCRTYGQTSVFVVSFFAVPSQLLAR